MKLLILIVTFAVYHLTNVYSYPITCLPEETQKNSANVMRCLFLVKFSGRNFDKEQTESPDVNVEEPIGEQKKEEDARYLEIRKENWKLSRCKYGYDAIGDCLRLEDIFF